MGAPPFLKVEEFPILEENNHAQHKVSTCLLVLEFFRERDFMKLICTDFTNNAQTSGGEFHRNGLDIPAGQLIKIPMHKTDFTNLGENYNEFYKKPTDFMKMWDEDSWFDVSDMLIIIKINLRLRLYRGILEPYTYDPEMVLYEDCGVQDSRKIHSLFKEIISRKPYFKLIESYARIMMPKELLSESSLSLSQQSFSNISIDNADNYEAGLLNEEFTDEDDEDEYKNITNGAITLNAPKIYSISEIKQIPMQENDETYVLLQAQVYGTFPDDWSYLAGKDDKTNQIEIRDLEMIVGDVHLDENTILDELNSLMIVVSPQELLNYIGYSSNIDFYTDISGAKQKFNQMMMNSPKRLKLIRNSQNINNSFVKVVWSLVEIQ